MTDREALLRAVVAAPTDDLPRLVLADWLDEHGDGERAAYIRTHVELARLVAAGAFDSDDYLAVALATAAVPPTSLWRWAADDGLPVPAPDGPLTRDAVADVDRVRDPHADLTLGYRRGFVEEVRCRDAYWLAHAAAAVRRMPVSRVELSNCRPYRHRPVEWVWVRAETLLGHEANVLPAALFDRLPQRQAYVAEFRTRREAEAALGEACLKYGRDVTDRSDPAA